MGCPQSLNHRPRAPSLVGPLPFCPLPLALDEYNWGEEWNYSWRQRMHKLPSSPLSLWDPRQVALINFKLSLVLKLG